MPPETPQPDAPDRLQRIEDKLDRLLGLAEQAEKFLHNPIGAYQAARRGKLRDPDGPPA